MKMSLSTNWCNQRIESAREIAEIALSLGFDELELGFNTTQEQYAWFRDNPDAVRIGSVHAYCPVPLSAPHGSPELYSLASPDRSERMMARLHILKTLECASSLGAESVVLHAGKIPVSSFFDRSMDSGTLHEALKAGNFDLSAAKYAKALAKARSRRGGRSKSAMDIVKKELEPILELFGRKSVVLALENLPFIEGFPDEAEFAELLETFRGAPLMAWFDTGHFRVRKMHGWLDSSASDIVDRLLSEGPLRGMHLNDVRDYFDDHFAPGGGNVDFAQYKEAAKRVRHVVFEPKAHVDAESLRTSLSRIKALWGV